MSYTEPLPLGREQIMEIIPHRDPFLFLDEIIELVPAQKAVAKWTLTGDEYFFKGHFPGEPVLPGVLMVEALAQAGAVTILCVPENRGKLALFAKMDNIRIKKVVRPGDTLTLSAEVEKTKGPMGTAAVTATVGGERVCYGKIMFAVR